MNWKSCLVLTLGIAFGGCLSQPEVARESGTHYVADAMKEYLDKGILPGAISILKEETVKNVLALSSRPKGMDGYSLGLRAPVVDGEDWRVGHGGAFATNCMVN